MELALNAVQNELCRILDQGLAVALVLLDLSAAFDHVFYDTLVGRLHWVGVRGRALVWIHYFLTDLTQSVCLHPFQSSAYVLCRVHPASSLSPTLFSLYVSPLAELIGSFQLSCTS